MGRVLAGLLDAQGRVPLLGDNDSGRVLVLRERPDESMAYLADLVATFLSDERLRLRGPAASEAVWLFGLECGRRREAWGALPGNLPVLSGAASGLATLRGSADRLLFAAQPNGTGGVGNHTHNDKLSFCLSVGRDVFFTDPGTLVYTASEEERNAFRSTAAHSTVQVDEEEQNRLVPGQLFMVRDDAAARIIEQKSGVRVVGTHDGYRRLADPVLHTRSIERTGSPLGWIIEDQLDGATEHTLAWRFVCGAGIRAQVAGPGLVRFYGEDGWLEMTLHPAALKVHIEPQRLAPAYGVSRDSSALVLSWRGKLPFRATFTVVWRDIKETA
jgi:hypothetical protein